MSSGRSRYPFAPVSFRTTDSRDTSLFGHTTPARATLLSREIGLTRDSVLVRHATPSFVALAAITMVCGCLRIGQEPLVAPGDRDAEPGDSAGSVDAGGADVAGLGDGAISDDASDADSDWDAGEASDAGDASSSSDALRVDGWSPDGGPAYVQHPLRVSIPSGFCDEIASDNQPTPPRPELVLTPAQASGLRELIAAVAPGTNIFLEDGVYPLEEPLVISAAGVTLRAKAGSSGNVSITGGAPGFPVLTILASDVLVADLAFTLGADDAIVVDGNSGAVLGTILYNLYFLDNPNANVRVRGAADDGVIACSVFERSDEFRTASGDACSNFYGINLQGPRGWILTLNVLVSQHCDWRTTGPAINLQGGTRDNMIIRNFIFWPFQGIRAGFSKDNEPVGRTYTDPPCGDGSYHDNYTSLICRNWIFADHRDFDSGIAAWSTCGDRIVHNTVISLDQSRQYSAIEWRFPETEVVVMNNLTNFRLLARENATATLIANEENAAETWFADTANGDLHLTADADLALDRGEPVIPIECLLDVDLEAARGDPDVGADEFWP